MFFPLVFEDYVGRHQTSEGEKNVTLVCLFELVLFRGCIALVLMALLETGRQILGGTDCAYENECVESHPATDVSFPNFTEMRRAFRVMHTELIP